MHSYCAHTLRALIPLATMYGSATLEVMFFLQILGDSGPFQLFTVHLCKLQQWVNGHDLKATIAGVDEILGPIWTALDVQREHVVTEGVQVEVQLDSDSEPEKLVVLPVTT